MQETVDRGTLAIKVDVLAREHRLNQRQVEILHELIGTDAQTIQELEKIFFDVSRRTLQRDLNRLEDAGAVYRTGETNQLKYFAKLT